MTCCVKRIAKRFGRMVSSIPSAITCSKLTIETEKGVKFVQG